MVIYLENILCLLIKRYTKKDIKLCEKKQLQSGRKYIALFIIEIFLMAQGTKNKEK